MSGIFKDIKDKMKELSDNHAIKKILAEKLRKMADKVESYALYAMELPLVDNNSAMVKIAEQIQMAGNKDNPTDRKDTYMNVGMTREELKDWASAYKDDGILSMAERWFIDLDINNHIPQEYRDDNWIDFLNDLKMAADYTIAKSPDKITAALDLANKADEKDKEKAVIDEIRRNIPLLVKGRFFGQKPEEKTGVALREEVAFEDQSKHFKLAAARIKVRLGEVKPKDGIKFDFVEIESNKDILNLIFQEGQDDDGKIHSSLAEVQKELQEGIAAEAERREQELNIFKEEADEHRRKINKAKKAAKDEGREYHELDRQGAEINKNNGINTTQNDLPNLLEMGVYEIPKVAGEQANFMKRLQLDFIKDTLKNIKLNKLLSVEEVEEVENIVFKIGSIESQQDYLKSNFPGEYITALYENAPQESINQQLVTYLEENGKGLPAKIQVSSNQQLATYLEENGKGLPAKMKLDLYEKLIILNDLTATTNAALAQDNSQEKLKIIMKYMSSNQTPEDQLEFINKYDALQVQSVGTQSQESGDGDVTILDLEENKKESSGAQTLANIMPKEDANPLLNTLGARHQIGSLKTVEGIISDFEKKNPGLLKELANKNAPKRE